MCALLQSSLTCLPGNPCLAVVPLDSVDLLLAILLLLIMAGVTLAFRLKLAGDILVAAGRMTAQLFLLGLVLKWLFTQESLLHVSLVAGVMLLVAGREVMVRQHRPLKGRQGLAIGLVSMGLSSFTLAVFAMLAIVQPEPWFKPQYAIPMLGMILGNTMTGIALSMDRVTASIYDQRLVVEQRLMLGATANEAVGDILRASLRTGMMPVINGMAVAGIVSLPGMMTGQILGGTEPILAVKYQILIWLLIATGTGLGMMAAARFTTGRLFDERMRLRLDRLHEPRKPAK